MNLPKNAKNRRLLVTMTNEPFHPVRLYYSIADRSAVIKKLRALKCMAEVPSEQSWQWLFKAEAAAIRFPAGCYEDVPKEKRPIVLGRFRFPRNGEMTLETNSIPRAIEGARFFGSRLGPQVVAIRCRVVNRCFAAEEGRLDELMKTIDRDVTVIDLRQTEATCTQEFKDLRGIKDPELAMAEFIKRKLASGEDVPMVEDFPLAPEEETPEFRDLAVTLQLRAIRAFEHWQGNTHLTLTAIIVRTVEQGAQADRGRQE
jgi:hypothetical protein